MPSSNETVYSLAFSLLNVTALKNLLPAYTLGGVGAKALFAVNAPDTYSGKAVVYRIINPPVPHHTNEGTLIQTDYDLEVMYMTTSAYQVSDWSVMTQVKSLLAGYHNASYTGYLIDIIAQRPLSSTPLEVNGIRYTVEGYSFKVIVREYF